MRELEMAIEFHEFPPGHHCTVCRQELSDEEVENNECGYCLHQQEQWEQYEAEQFRKWNERERGK